LKNVGLADHADVKVEKLPSNLKRRLAFGRAILHDPSVLLLSEPFAKCDDTSVALLSELVHQLATDGAATLIFAEDTAKLDPLCDMIYRLEKGRIVDAYRPGEEPRADLPFMIPAKQEGKVDLVDPADILYVMAQDDRAFLQTADGLLLQHVKEVIPFTRDSFTLRLKDDDGTQIPLSKSAARELRELLGY